MYCSCTMLFFGVLKVMSAAACLQDTLQQRTPASVPTDRRCFDPLQAGTASSPCSRTCQQSAHLQGVDGSAERHHPLVSLCCGPQRCCKLGSCFLLFVQLLCQHLHRSQGVLPLLECGYTLRNECKVVWQEHQAGTCADHKLQTGTQAPTTKQARSKSASGAA